MIKFYISEGLLIASVIGCLIVNKQNKRNILELNDKVNNLAGVVKTMKKERIDDWFESASDILTSHQESIDALEDASKARFAFEQNTTRDIDRLGDEIKDIKEILEKTAGVKFFEVSTPNEIGEGI